MKVNANAKSGRKGIALLTTSLVLLLACAAGLGAWAGTSPESVSIHAASPLSEAFRLLEEGKISEAKKLFAEELRRNPKSIDAVRGLAFSARDEGNDEEAVKWLDKWTRLNPKSPVAWRHLALACHRLGRDLEAMSAAQTAISLSPGGDASMSDLMARLLSSKDALGGNLPSSPESSREFDAPGRRGRGAGMDQVPGVRTPTVPDPTKAIPGRRARD